MGEESLSKEELDSLLEGAEIISDDTGKYKVSEPKDESKLEKYNPQSFPDKNNKLKQYLDGQIDITSLTFEQHRNTELLLDVSVGITVELGRVNISVKEILGLGEGSIIELNKPASEPVDLLVNDRLIARGEVVVIDENFGTRLTQIVPAQ